MQSHRSFSWGRAQFLPTLAVAGLGVLTQVACSGPTETPDGAPFESAVTTHTLAGGKKGPVAGGGPNMDPYCAMLQIMDDPHPPHGCHPTSCEACQNLAWLWFCGWVETAGPVAVEKYFGLAAGFVLDWGLMWASILNVFGTYASDFLCGGNSNIGMNFWMQNTCTTYGYESQECQAAQIAFTCSCMNDAGARTNNRSTMDAMCGYCGCYRARKYTGGADQLAGGMACLKKGKARPGRGRTFGDPNLTSFDGVRIADNRAGEFIGVRKLAGTSGPDVDVHFRYEPWNGSQIVSQVTAVAVKAGNTRVAVYAGDPLQIRVNGELVEVPEDGLFTSDLIDVYSEGYAFHTVVLPSGDALTVTGLGAMLNVSVELTEEHLDGVEGVLGVWDQDPSDEPWEWGTNDFRVTSQADSLFDYGPGESLATFDDPGFPHQYFDPGQVSPGLAMMALSQCSSAGIVDTNILDGCVHDVLATNFAAPEFLVAAAAMDLEVAGESPVDALPPDMGGTPPDGPGDPGGGAGAGAPGMPGMPGMPGGAGAPGTGSGSGSGMFGMGGYPSP